MLKFSPCKINIGLNITAKRNDGYHDIVTAMVPVPWYDIVEIVPIAVADSKLTVLGRHVDCPPEKNLVMKAYNELKVLMGLPAVHIILQKIIPDGAGLGGGSADAATTLLVLNELFNLGLSSVQLAEVASRIGADCPFFIYSKPMMCTGTGTIMHPIDLDLAGYTLLIAKPKGVNVSTKDAYAGITPHQPDKPVEELLRLPIDQWQGKITNDFEPVIFSSPNGYKCRQLLDLMLENDAVYSSMSGSGSSIYGIFKSEEEARKCKAQLDESIDVFIHTYNNPNILP